MKSHSVSEVVYSFLLHQLAFEMKLNWLWYSTLYLAGILVHLFDGYCCCETKSKSGDRLNTYRGEKNQNKTLTIIFFHVVLLVKCIWHAVLGTVALSISATTVFPFSGPKEQRVLDVAKVGECWGCLYWGWCPVLGVWAPCSKQNQSSPQADPAHTCAYASSLLRTLPQEGLPLGSRERRVPAGMGLMGLCSSSNWYSSSPIPIKSHPLTQMQQLRVHYILGGGAVWRPPWGKGTVLIFGQASTALMCLLVSVPQLAKVWGEWERWEKHTA